MGEVVFSRQFDKFKDQNNMKFFFRVCNESLGRNKLKAKVRSPKGLEFGDSALELISFIEVFRSYLNFPSLHAIQLSSEGR